MDDWATRLLEHNDWANLELVRVCSALDSDLLGQRPHGGSGWSVRETLIHLADAQLGYAALLHRDRDSREVPRSTFEELPVSLMASGRRLRDWVTDPERDASTRVRSSDGYEFEPWVVVVQAINHAHDHRRQVCGALRELGVEPPRIDGWGFGEAMGCVTRVE